MDKDKDVQVVHFKENTEATKTENKLDSFDWTIIEYGVERNSIEEKVMIKLLEHSDNLFKHTEDKKDNLDNLDSQDKKDIKLLKVLGDSSYMYIRTQLIENKYFEDIDIVNEPVEPIADKKKIKKGTKPHQRQTNIAGKIRQEQAEKNLKKNLDKYIGSFKFDNFIKPQAFNDDILEMRAIGLFQMAKYIINNKKKYITHKKLNTKNMFFIFSIIVALEKFIRYVSSYTGICSHDTTHTELFSPQCLKDLISISTYVKELFNFNGLDVYKNTPQLLIFSEFDNILPNIALKPYEHQILLHEQTFNTLLSDKQTVINLKTMPGSGKTTDAVAIANIVKHLRIYREQYKDFQFIYCCSLKFVMTKVAQLLW